MAWDIAIAINNSPWVHVYPFTHNASGGANGGYGTKYTNPTTLPGDTCYKVAFCGSTDIAVSQESSSPYIYAYPWCTGVGFGAKYSDPSTLPVGPGTGLSFNGTDVALGSTTNPYLAIYPWTPGFGFGTKYNDSGTAPGATYKVSFSPAGTDIATAHNITPYVNVWPFTHDARGGANGGFGTKYNDPGTKPASSGVGVAFSSDGTDIAVAHATTPYVTAYPWTHDDRGGANGGFGTKYNDPGTTVNSNSNGIAFCYTDTSVSPTLASATPSTAQRLWTGDVILAGTHLTGVTQSWFGAGITINSITVNNDNQVTVNIRVGMNTPTGTITNNPSVTSPNGSAVLASGFTITEAPATGYDIAMADLSTYLKVYPWTHSDSGSNYGGFGNQYSLPSAATGVICGVAFCGSTDVAGCTDTSPYVVAYPWISGTGFGTKYADPATPPAGATRRMAFNGSTDVAVGHQTSPYVTAYPWTPGVGFGVKYSNPASLPGQTGAAVSFSSAGNDIALATNGSAYIAAYPFTHNAAGGASGGFGTKYNPPGIFSSTQGDGIAFNGSSDVAFGSWSTPFIETYPWTHGTGGANGGFGTKYNDPASLPANGGEGVAFSPAGTDVAIASYSISPYIAVYPFTHNASGGANGGYGTKYNAPATSLPAACDGVSFSPLGTDIAIATEAAPYIQVYPWTHGTGGANGGFGTKYSDPLTALPYSTAVVFGYTNPSTVPTVVSATPNNAKRLGTANIVIAGTYLTGATKVDFGTGITVNSYSVDNANQITANITVAMNATTGARNVTVCATNGWGTGTSVFTVNEAPPTGYSVAFAHGTSPYVSTYPWTHSASGGTTGGFGNKYSDPGTPLTDTAYGIAFSSLSDIAIAYNASPYVCVFPWSHLTGFGTKYSDPGSAIGSQGYGVQFSSAGTDIAISTASTPYVYAYPFTHNLLGGVHGGFGTKYNDPGTKPTGAGSALAFNGSTDAAVAHTTSPYVTAWPWSHGTGGANGGFGTKYNNPGTAVSGTGDGISFSPAGNDVAVSSSAGSPYVSAYPFTHNASGGANGGFGTKYSDPATIPTGLANDIVFSSAGTDIAIAHNVSPDISVYPWTHNDGGGGSGGFGTKYNNPGTAVGSNGSCVAFTSVSTDIVVGSVSGYVSAYPWTHNASGGANGGFGTVYSSPLTMPTGYPRHVAFGYTDITPVVSSCTPDHGTQGDVGDSIVIAGTYFTDATVVSFGANITVNSFVVDSDIQITANITIAGGAATGARNVTVTNAAGTGTGTNVFTVNGAGGGGGRGIYSLAGQLISLGVVK